VQALAHALIAAFDLPPAVAVLLAFALAGAAVLGVVAGVVHALTRLTLKPKE
jgi:hypothetical protein